MVIINTIDVLLLVLLKVRCLVITLPIVSMSYARVVNRQVKVPQWRSYPLLSGHQPCCFQLFMHIVNKIRVVMILALYLAIAHRVLCKGICSPFCERKRSTDLTCTELISSEGFRQPLALVLEIYGGNRPSG